MTFDTDFRERLRAQAIAEGFTAARVTSPNAIAHVPDRLQAFVQAEYHGQMAWMEDRLPWRGDPRKLWGDVQSILMVAESYTPPGDPLEHLGTPDVGN
ncbi:MAG: epoxyqueuosine reductase, partial [Pseudomonadota bacterium]